MPNKKIIVTSKNYVDFIDLEEILFCQANGGYTSICLIDGKKLIRSKTLNAITGELNSSVFLRVSQSYVVNLRHIYQIDKVNKCIELCNGAKIPFTISLKELLELIRF